MNIVAGRRGAAGIEAAAGAIRLAASAVPEGTIEIGVRPEDLKVAEPEAGEAGATVVEVEPLGGYTVVTLDAGATRLRALHAGSTRHPAAEPGGFALRSGKAAFFRTGWRSTGQMSNTATKQGPADAAMGFAPDVTVRNRDYRIGCVGAGMIMAECHLAAYKEAGFPVAAIASRTRANAAKVAERWGIATVHDTPEALIEDKNVEIIDLAYPPDQQPALIRHALKQPHIKAILAQKPLALSLDEAIRLRDEAQGRRQDPLGQPEHALRPVDARAEADHRIAARSATSSSRRSTCTPSRTGRDFSRTTTG